MHVKALEAYLKTAGTAPVNVKLLLEGEEEVSSPNLRPFIVEHLDLLRADVAVISDTSMRSIEEPAIIHSLRGMTSVSYTHLDVYKRQAQRIHMNLVQADIARIDHFRGFAGYWEIPASEATAVKGQWVDGPGIPFFQAIQERMGDLPIIAEDLGVMTPDVEELRDRFAFPGMKILQFAFGGEQNSDFLPFNFVPNSVVYTGTHDNETTLGWYLNASEEERDHVRRYICLLYTSRCV